MIETVRGGLQYTGRAFEALSRSFESMHAAAYILGSAALLSSLLALVRDRLFAHTFGADVELDVYYAAFRIPDLLFIAVGSLVSAFVLIPELKKRLPDEQMRYLDAVVVGFAVLAVALSAMAAIFAPALLSVLYPALAASSWFPTLVLTTRIMLLQPILLGLSNIAAALTQSRGRFLLFALAPLLYNVGIIFGLLFLYPALGFAGLACGVVLGAALHLAIQLPSAFSDGFLSRSPRFSDAFALFSTAAISIPRALALSLQQFSFMGLTVLASFLTTGSIAVFTFAHNLQAVPLAIVGASYSVAAFPVLAGAFARGDIGEFSAQVASAARHVLFWSLPAVALIIVLRAHIVRTVLGSGSFDWTDTRLTAAALALFTTALASQSIALLLIRAYYASGRTLVPVSVSAFTAFLTLGGAWWLFTLSRAPFVSDLFEALLRVEELPGSEVLVLPLAFSIASLIGALILALFFNYHFGGFFSRIRDVLGESLAAAFAAGIVAYAVLYAVGDVTLSSTLASVFFRGLLAGIAGIVAAALSYRLLESAEYTEVSVALRKRIWRETPVVGSVEETER